MITMIAHGRIGRDAELRYTTNGTAAVDLALGCNYGMKGEDGKKPTQWVRATIWGKQAEALAPYLTKGKGVVVVMKDAHERTFTKSDGSVATSLEGTVIDFDFTGAGPREEAAPAPRPAPPPKPAAKPAPTGFDDMDDDLPPF